MRRPCAAAREEQVRWSCFLSPQQHHATITSFSTPPQHTAPARTMATAPPADTTPAEERYSGTTFAVVEEVCVLVMLLLLLSCDTCHQPGTTSASHAQAAASRCRQRCCCSRLTPLCPAPCAGPHAGQLAQVLPQQKVSSFDLRRVQQQQRVVSLDAQLRVCDSQPGGSHTRSPVALSAAIVCPLLFPTHNTQPPSHILWLQHTAPHGERG